MPSYCCSSSDFLQSLYTVLYPVCVCVCVPFFVHLWCCSLHCIFKIPQFRISSLCLSHKFRTFAVTKSSFFWRCLPRISLAVSVTAVLKVEIIESMSAYSLFRTTVGVRQGCVLSPILFELSSGKDQDKCIRRSRRHRQLWWWALNTLYGLAYPVELPWAIQVSVAVNLVCRALLFSFVCWFKRKPSIALGFLQMAPLFLRPQYPSAVIREAIDTDTIDSQRATTTGTT